ncbi:MAG TPA: hypothetical protein VJU14_12235 [Solirubrobacterales bacterium]|nr:hypothetical protein [Solirubrobacterales bacterium]
MSTPPDKHAERYVFQRWGELCAANGPWWTRATEVGVRLRLDELHDLSKAAGEGAVRLNTVVEKLFKEAKGLLIPGEEQDPYVADRFPEIADQASSLEHVSLASFVAGGLGPGIFKSCLDNLEGPEYVQGLAAHLGKTVESAGHTQDDFRALDKVVCRLDAELVYDGHSRSWRNTVLEEAKKKHEEEGAALHEAIEDALKAHHHGVKREFEVLIPITSLSTMANIGRLKGIEVNPAIEMVRDWDPDDADAVMQLIGSSKAVSHFSAVGAPDAEAAVRLADKQIRSAIGAWRLMEREVKNPEQAIVYDPRASETFVLPLPSEPLEVRPAGVEQWQAEDDDRSRRLSDALDQLAQARTAPPQTAFVDLWTAADALYGGIATDPGWHAGDVMAGLAQFVYVRDVHLWLAACAEQAGLGAPAEGDEVAWIVQQITSNTNNLEAALAGAGDAVAWSRFKVMTGWDGGWGLRKDLDRLAKRLVSVCDRAYLIRNFAVHRAEVRGPALEIVLPAFAGLVAAAVGHSLSAQAEDTLTEALAAGLKARSVAYDFKNQRSSAPQGLQPMLSWT